MGEDLVQPLTDHVVGGFLPPVPGAVRRLGQIRFQDVPGVPARQANRLPSKGVRWVEFPADHAGTPPASSASDAKVRGAGGRAPIDAPDLATSSAAATGPLIAGLAGRPIGCVGVGRRGLAASTAGAELGLVTLAAERGAV